MSLSGAYGTISEDDALRLLDSAIDLGVTHFDTADIYGMGLSEEKIARFLKSRRPRLTIASKGGIRFMRATGQRYVDNSPEYLQSAIDNSLRRLGIDRIDLYYVHRREKDRPIEEVMDALASFKRSGKIGSIGLSEVAPDTLRRAHRVDRVAAVQSEFSLWTRKPEKEMLKLTAEMGIGFVASSPLGRGVMTSEPPDPSQLPQRDFRKRNPRFSDENYPRNLAAIEPFKAMAREHGVDPATLAIAWCLAKGPHVVAIPGTRTPEHLKACVDGVGLRLSAADIAAIEGLFPDEFPWGNRYAPAQMVGVEDAA